MVRTGQVAMARGRSGSTSDEARPDRRDVDDSDPNSQESISYSV
jgi:hypothetical protein